MRVAQITHVFLPHIGGLELYVYRLARDLSAAGESVDVITTSLGNSNKIPGQYHFNFNTYRYKSNCSFMRNPFSYGLFKHLKNHDYDILHLHSMWFIPSLFAAWFKKKAKIFMTVHGVYPEELPWHQKILVKLYKPLANYVCRKTDLFIVLSENEKKKLQKHFKVPEEKIRVIPNGFDYHEPPEEPHKELNKKIIFTGRLVPIKSPEVLIEAISKTYNNFSVNFVGPCMEDYKQVLLNLAHNKGVRQNITFSGEFDPINEASKLMKLYQEADLSVSIGKWEGLPTRIFESLYNGTPCVLYAPNNEIFKDQVKCFKINELNSDELALKLDLAMYEDLYEKVKKNGMELAKNYEWQKLFRQIYREYYKV